MKKWNSWSSIITLTFRALFQVETLRASKNDIIKILFLNPLSKTGNLTVAYNEQMPIKSTDSKRSKWGAALVAEKQKLKVKLLIDKKKKNKNRFRDEINLSFELNCHFRWNKNWTLFRMGNTLNCIRCALCPAYFGWHRLKYWKDYRLVEIAETLISFDAFDPHWIISQELSM